MLNWVPVSAFQTSIAWGHCPDWLLKGTWNQKVPWSSWENRWFPLKILPTEPIHAPDPTGGDTRVSKRMPWIFRNEVANVGDLQAALVLLYKPMELVTIFCTHLFRIEENLCIYFYRYVYIYIYVFLFYCIYIYIYVCVYVYIYT